MLKAATVVSLSFHHSSFIIFALLCFDFCNKTEESVNYISLQTLLCDLLTKEVKGWEGPTETLKGKSSAVVWKQR